jgi:hypothetical protein
MNRYDFDEGLERIKRTFPKLDDGTIDEVERRWMGLDVSLWRLMCSWVIENATFAPKPAKFKEAHAVCRKSWRSESLAEKKKDCPRCFKSSGFNWIYYRANNGFPYSGITPCLNCNRDQHIPHSDIKIESYMPEKEWDAICRNPEPEPVFQTRITGAVLDRHDRGPSK